MPKSSRAIASAPHFTSARFEKKLPTASAKRVMSLPSEAVVTAPRVRPPSEPEGFAHAGVRERRGDDVGVEGDTVQRRDAHDDHPGRPRGGDARLGILERHAPLRLDPETPGGLDVDV